MEKERVSIQQLEKWMDTEIGALRYYGFREDVDKLTVDSDIYAETRSIGYTKRPMPLVRRCSMVSITADNPVTENTSIEDLYLVYTWSRDNVFTALEIVWKLFPKRRPEILRLLTKNQYES